MLLSRFIIFIKIKNQINQYNPRNPAPGQFLRRRRRLSSKLRYGFYYCCYIAYTFVTG